MIKVSIIIPIYNCEKHIERNYLSLKNQDYDNLEIVLIDDGSTDNSSKICDEIASNDKRVIVKHITNGGVSNARNVGLATATGEYVMFIDADDYLKESCINKCVDIIERKKVDIVKFNYVKKLNKIFKKNVFEIPCNVVILQEDYKRVYEKIFETDNLCNVWGSLIKKEIAISEKFDKNLSLGEDFLYFISCFMKSKSIYVIDEALYMYIVNDDSITHNFNLDKSIKLLSDAIKVNSIIEGKIKQQLGLKIVRNLKSIRNIEALLYSCIENSNYRLYKSYIQKIKFNKIIAKEIIYLGNDFSKTTKKLIKGSLINFMVIKIVFSFKNIIKYLLAKV